jgi:hypothetical protein
MPGVGESVICPKCGEVNSSNFLFCGMCGTMLEPARKASPPAPTKNPVPSPASPPASISRSAIPTLRVEERPASAVPATRPVAPGPAAPARPASADSPRAAVPPIGGPSLLGLDQANADSIHERAFSNLESYGEESKFKGTRILLLFLLLAALGGGYWWIYTHYLRVTDNHRPVTQAAVPAADTGSNLHPKGTPSDGDVLPIRSGAHATPPPVTPAPPAQKPDTGRNEPKSASATTPAPAPPRHEVSATRLPAQPADDSGDALFRRGEHYLYGRGGAEDCVNALKYLKMASYKQNAKARSAMGTMYATGHCVSRDLPSAYRWFALALRADPNNSVVEQNLTSVWNQMTPPERQLATRSE